MSRNTKNEENDNKGNKIGEIETQKINEEIYDIRENATVNVGNEKVDAGREDQDSPFFSDNSPDPDSAFFDEDRMFLNGEYVIERLGVTEKTLFSLSSIGQFSMGAIAKQKVIIAETLYNYLDRVHYVQKTSPDQETVLDSKGKVKKDLTVVGEHHNRIPKLLPVSHFAKEFGIDERTFIRHCEIGTFIHYRIGTLYKMTKEDYAKSLAMASSTGRRSNRGVRKPKDGETEIKPKGKPGRKNKVREKAAEMAKENNLV